LETLVLARAGGARERDFQEEWNACGNGKSLTVWSVDVDGMHLSGILYSVEEPREGAAKATIVRSIMRTAISGMGRRVRCARIGPSERRWKGKVGFVRRWGILPHV
jgi:hypothetical protein